MNFPHYNYFSMGKFFSFTSFALLTLPVIRFLPVILEVAENGFFVEMTICFQCITRGKMFYY